MVDVQGLLGPHTAVAAVARVIEEMRMEAMVFGLSGGVGK
jgi:hypothetical protein